MRIAVVDTYYPAFVAEHYRRRPGLLQASYDEQMASLMSRCFGTSDAYSHHLSELGHVAIDLGVNCFELQKAWAREHGRKSLLRLVGSLPTRVGNAARTGFFRDVAKAQIAEFDPEVIYLQDLWFFGRKQLDAFRAEGRVVVGQVGSSPPGTDVLRGLNLLTTSFPHFVSRFRAVGIDTEYFRIGFYDRVLEHFRAGGVDADAEARREVPLAFVGTLHPSPIYDGGTAFFERLCNAVPLQIWGSVNDGLRPGSPILERFRGEAWGLDMYEVLARSGIAINRHGDIAEGHSNNMRLYEATGVGALLMTEASQNLNELFEPGHEVIDYESENDLVEKIRHYLEHEDERRRVAASGQARTLRDHTYRSRMAELDEMLKERLP